MILVISISLTMILIYLLQKNRNAVKTLVPPSPPSLPLIGNLHQFGTASNLPFYLSQLSKNYGPIMQIKIGSVPVLVIGSAKLAKEVLKTQDSAFCSRPKLLGSRKLSYNCLDIVLSPYGDHWREDVFLAGTDTSAAAIVWIMTALMKAPNVMEKVQAEIRNLIGKKGKVDEDDLPKLPYLKAVINETFRLYPPATLLVARETIQRCILEGYEIQPKTVVYVNVWAVARDPECWENPDEFLPERFLNIDIDIKGQDFGSGRRNCPGMFMGLANVGVTIANLLYSFDWELPPGIHAEDVDTDALPGIVVHKKNALLLVPKQHVV